MNLSELRIDCEQRNIPIISVETEILLKKILIKHKPKYCLEIGSAVGYSTMFISSIIKEWWGFLYSFEISYPAYVEANRNLKQYGIHNATIYPFSFLSIEENFLPENIDFAFIDGHKVQYTSYMMKLIDMLDTKSTLVFDDVLKFFNKTKSLYEYLDKNQIYYQEISTEPGDWILLIEDFLKENIEF